MSELTDLEICKRIAEIDGVNAPVCVGPIGKWTYKINEFDSEYYNPLTDKALCFDLMVKYELDLQAPYRPHNEVEWEVGYWVDGVSDAGFVRDKNPQRAICLAIIKKSELE